MQLRIFCYTRDYKCVKYKCPNIRVYVRKCACLPACRNIKQEEKQQYVYSANELAGATFLRSRERDLLIQLPFLFFFLFMKTVDSRTICIPFVFVDEPHSCSCFCNFIGSYNYACHSVALTERNDFTLKIWNGGGVNSPIHRRFLINVNSYLFATACDSIIRFCAQVARVSYFVQHVLRRL